MKKSLFYLLVAITIPSAGYANFPTFKSTPEIERCLEHSDDWNNCIKDASEKELAKIKQEYRQILGDATIMEWNKSIVQGKQFLYDVYESWTAYRNRVCSLYKLSAQFTGSFFNDELSCTLDQMNQHSYYLSNIIMLMQKQTPANKNDYNFLRFEHSDDYRQCIRTNKKRTQKENCLGNEVAVLSKELEELYKKAESSEKIGAWNNGPNLQNGNYRDMYDSWIAYRNRICSLAVWAYNRVYGNNEMPLDQCIAVFNNNKRILMQDIMDSSVTFLEEVPESALKHYDTAENAGKRIAPLQRRFNVVDGFTEETLKNESATANARAESENPSTAPQTEENIPSWAKSPQ